MTFSWRIVVWFKTTLDTGYEVKQAMHPNVRFDIHRVLEEKGCAHLVFDDDPVGTRSRAATRYPGKIYF